MLYPEYVRPNINSDDIAEGLGVMLRELFSEAKYSDDMKYIYQYVCKNSIEDAIYREFLANTDIVQLDFENGGDLDNKRKFMLRLAVVYFLHCRHNAKLRRCKAELAELREPDSYLARRVFRAAEKCCPDAYGRFIAGTPNARELFREAAGISIVFEYTRYTEPMRGQKQRKSVFTHILYAPNYHDGNIQVIISLKKAEYKNCRTYEECLKYLISERGNVIYGFPSTEAVWRNAMNERKRPLLEESRTTTKVKVRNPHDIELALFCLALGLNHDVYSWLKELRNAKFNVAPKKPQNPPIGADELRMLEDFLQNASERLMCADECAKGRPLSEIPKERAYSKSRNMVINAFLDLLKHKMRPITMLTDTEIDYLIKAGEISQETLDSIYEDYYVENQKGETQHKRTFNPDLKHDGICKILLDECRFLDENKFGTEPLSLIKAKYLELGLDVRAAEHLRYNHAITGDEMIQAGIPEDIAELLTSTEANKLKNLLDSVSVRKKFGGI